MHASPEQIAMRRRRFRRGHLDRIPPSLGEIPQPLSVIDWVGSNTSPFQWIPRWSQERCNRQHLWASKNGDCMYRPPQQVYGRLYTVILYASLSPRDPERAVIIRSRTVFYHLSTNLARKEEILWVIFHLSFHLNPPAADRTRDRSDMDTFWLWRNVHNLFLITLCMYCM